MLAGLVHVQHCLSDQNVDVKQMRKSKFEFDEQRAGRSILRTPRSTNSQKTPDDPLLKVLSFADDIDNKVDSEGEFTRATLERENFPDSFTICLAFMVDAWTTDFAAGRVFHMLKDDERNKWGFVEMNADPLSYTEYKMKLGSTEFVAEASTVFFPLQWTRMCMSLDFPASKMRLFVDGQLMLDGKYEKEKDSDRPTHLRLSLGLGINDHEYTGNTTNFNMFSSALPMERMQRMTLAGDEEC